MLSGHFDTHCAVIFMSRPTTTVALPLLILCGMGEALAIESLNEAISRQVQANQEAAAAQNRIDEISEETRRLLEDYRETLRRSEAAQTYNAQLRPLLQSQSEERRSLEKQLGEVESIRRDLVPLMARMLEALERFVELDRPFHIEERRARLAELRAVMKRTDLNDADKFKQLIELYRVEHDYGNGIEAYRAELRQGEGARTVDFLRVGRVGLYYRTLDGRESGVWDNRTRSWVTLPEDQGRTIAKGLAMARKEALPDLLPIPLERPEVVQ